MNKAIKKIELDLGGKTVTLTPEQAKNLKNALDDLFGKEVIHKTEYIHEHTYLPKPIEPLRPYWESIWRRDWQRDTPYYKTSEITCSYTPDTGVLSLTG